MFMKKRVNITIDEGLHDWAVLHFGEGEFSKLVQNQLLSISSSIQGAKTIMECDDNEKVSFLEKFDDPRLELAMARGFKAFEKLQEFENSPDGVPLDFSPEIEDKMKRIMFYLNSKEENLTKRKYKALIESKLNFLFSRIVDEFVNIILLTKDEEKKNKI